MPGIVSVTRALTPSAAVPMRRSPRVSGEHSSAQPQEHQQQHQQQQFTSGINNYATGMPAAPAMAQGNKPQNGVMAAINNQTKADVVLGGSVWLSQNVRGFLEGFSAPLPAYELQEILTSVREEDEEHKVAAQSKRTSDLSRQLKDLQKSIEALVWSESAEERKLRETVEEILRQLGPACTSQDVAAVLAKTGVVNIVCKTKWETSEGCPGGIHDFLEVVTNWPELQAQLSRDISDFPSSAATSTNSSASTSPSSSASTPPLIPLPTPANVAAARSSSSYSNLYPSQKFNSSLLVELDLRSQFEIARPSKQFADLLERIPRVFVGRSERLRRLADRLCAATICSIECAGLPVPPWRRRDYVLSKWFGPFSSRLLYSVPSSSSPASPEKLSEAASATVIQSGRSLVREVERLDNRIGIFA